MVTFCPLFVEQVSGETENVSKIKKAACSDHST